MTREDIAAVAEIERQTFSIPWSEKSFEESIALPHTIFIVACMADNVVGYCGMYKVFNEGDIANIAVASEYRNRGVGKALMEAIIQESRKSEIKDMTLEVRESNQIAIRLYENFGFENIGIRKGFYDRPKENAVIMWRKEQ